MASAVTESRAFDVPGGTAGARDLGATLRRLARVCGTDDPLAGGDYDRAPVRVRAYFDSAIPAGEVVRVERVAGGGFEVVTWFLNIAGVAGWMDSSVQRLLLHRGSAMSVREALDRATHRLVALWYEAYRRAEPGHQEASRAISWGEALLPSAAGLRSHLTAVMGLPVRVEDRVGRWAGVAGPEGRTLLRVDPAYGCRLIVGPIEEPMGREFAPPDGRLLVRLLGAARGYAGSDLRAEVVVLRRGEREAARADAGRHRFDAGLGLGPCDDRDERAVRVDWDACERILRGVGEEGHAERS